MEIVITYEACEALLKKSFENGHFHAFSPMNFSNSNDRYGDAAKVCLDNTPWTQ